MKKKLAMALMTATMGLAFMTGSAGALHVKSACMDENFATFENADGSQRFKNQGQCIRYVNTDKE